MFFIPIIASLAACTYFWLVSDMHKGWKIGASFAVFAALAMQFTTLGEGVPFIIPTMIEIIVGLWGAIAMKLDRA